MIVIIIIFAIVLVVLAFQIKTMETAPKFRRAIERCKKCKNYSTCKPDMRFPFETYWFLTPEQVSGCSRFQEKDQE